jgi:hypothetical protein
MKKMGIVLIGVFIAFFTLKSYFGFNDNSLSVRVDSNLNLSKVKIYKGFFPFDTLKVDKVKELHQLIFNGKQLEKIQSDYGENDFIILYNDRYYCKVRHNKTNNRQADTYSFKLFKNKDDLKLVLDITGTDRQKSVKSLLRIPGFTSGVTTKLVTNGKNE